MGFLSDHPHTAITETIFRIVSSRDYTLEVELAPLIQLIKADHNDYNYTVNQEEAARALRKKIKYGNRLQQSRTLDLLDLFISQGVKFTVMYNDDKLLQRLRGMATNSENSGSGEKYEPRIIKKCAASLSIGSNSQTEVLEEQPFPRSGGGSGGRSNFMDDSADDTLYQSNSLTSADRLYRIPQINMNKEAPRIRLIISDALASAVSLQNSLIGLPKGKFSTDDEEATSKFIQARAIRRKVLRYLQLVTEGEFLGSLIHANDELVAALTAYDDRSAQDDSSDESDHGSYDDGIYDENEQDNSRYIDSESSEEESLSSYQPSTISNPFGDHNKI
ncbi:Lsb5p [Saccharomyces cerevisiae]|nr:Lsb5p [Saccharomyces cerevisiae]